MNIEEYKTYWSDCGETLYTYSPARVGRGKVDNDTFIFLTTWGLPSDAAPFLNFGEVEEDSLMTPNQVLGLDVDGLDNYLMFGSNGSGDPVCIDTIKQSEIVYLNHDNYFERIFINNSIRQFALCLIKYRDFVLSLVDTGTNAYKRRKFSNEEFATLKNEFIKIDHRGLIDNSFWVAELDNLLWERDNE